MAGKKATLRKLQLAQKMVKHYDYLTRLTRDPGMRRLMLRWQSRVDSILATLKTKGWGKSWTC